jgi:hypothetical protein
MNEDRPDEKFDALLRHTLSHAPMPEPPPGFAREMAALAADEPEAAAVEIWITRVLVILVVLASGAGALFVIDSIALRLQRLLDGAPWPLLLTAAAAIGGIKLAEIARAAVAGKTRRA